jgi:hypothetical protein
MTADVANIPVDLVELASWEPWPSLLGGAERPEEEQ